MQSLRLLIVVGVTLIVGSDARADQLKLSDGRCLKEVPSLVSKSKPQHTEVSLIECGIDKSKTTPD
jgi:hypothetical protein